MMKLAVLYVFVCGLATWPPYMTVSVNDWGGKTLRNISSLRNVLCVATKWDE